MPRRLSRALARSRWRRCCSPRRPALALEPLTRDERGRRSPPAPRPSRRRATRPSARRWSRPCSRPRARCLPPERFAREAERLRDDSSSRRRRRFVLTYRVDGRARAARTSPLDPEIQEWVLPVTARDRHGAAPRVPGARGLPPRRGRAAVAGDPRALRSASSRRRRRSGALSHLGAGAPHEARGAAVRAGRVGAPAGRGERADAARSSSRAGVGRRRRRSSSTWTGGRTRRPPASPGGVAEVRARALRSDDGSELAIARFEAAGYDADRDEAIARALLARRAPARRRTSALQLERNWQAQTPGERPVELELEAVSSLVQVDAVRRALLGHARRAKSAEIRDARRRRRDAAGGLLALGRGLCRSGSRASTSTASRSPRSRRARAAPGCGSRSRPPAPGDARSRRAAKLTPQSRN